ncbi:MAG: TonB-dependent receptor [Bacteroidota bacterium]
MLRYLFCSIFIFLPLFLLAQTPTQTVRGKIVDASNNQSLIGATIAVLGTNLASTTDADGNFRIEAVAVGRQQIQVNYLGYQSIILPVLVESGKEVVLDVALQSTQTGLDTIVVKSPRLTAIQPLSSQTITIEETFRYPATFYDPARMMSLYPGVANINNQANAISVRGNSPNFNQWRLEDVEIVNPNHTPNAGTFSDRITQSAGGVNILSAQLLDYSTFLTSAYAPQYNNALGGILDMKLRKGNDEKHEFIGQIGLIGIDVAAEGPISKKSKASYLANYRYSTIGLLSDLGVDVGDEDISFQDFSLNLSFPTQKAGDFTLFGVWGESDNVFITERDSTLWEENKDRFDIIFDARTVIAGGTHRLKVGQNGIWKTSFAYSQLQSGRTSQAILDNSDQFFSEDQNDIRKTSLHSYYSNQLSASSNLRAGFTATNHFLAVVNRSQDLTDLDLEASGWLLQPYVNWSNQFKNGFGFDLGLSYSYFDLTASSAIEPRLALHYQLNNKQRLSFSYGLHSQIQLPQLYYDPNCPAGQNCDVIDLDMNRAHHLVLGYQYQINNTTTFGAEAYLQYLFDIPTSSGLSNFSAINLLEIDRPFIGLNNNGLGSNYGVEFNFQKVLLDDYYLLTNVSLFESVFGNSDNLTLDTRWNGNFISNLTGGKEWKWQKKERQMIFGANVNIAYLGGFREIPIDVEQSKANGMTQFVEDQLFSINQPNFFKTDLRVYLKRNKAKYNTTLALDIQNASNQQNIAYQYYDQVQGEVLTQNQLGLIPILTWRIEW